MLNNSVLQWIWRRYRQRRDTIAAAVIEAPARSPYPAGSMMAFDRGGAVVGSVSPGCVEADLYDRAQQLFREHSPGLEEMGCHTVCFEAESASADPLAPFACAGTLFVAIHPVTAAHFPDLRGLLAAQAAGRRVCTALDLQTGRTAVVSGKHAGHAQFFLTVYPAPMRLLVFGVSDIAVELAHLAPRLGYAVTVCDPRSAFLRQDRFPVDTELVTDWPDRYLRRQRDEGRIGADAAVVDLSHDERFSVPLLLEALDTSRWPDGNRPGYVGALGSRVRSEETRLALRESGLSAADETRLHAPIGLDLGGRRAPHIALSIAAQLVATSADGTGLPLSPVTAECLSTRTE